MMDGSLAGWPNDRVDVWLVWLNAGPVDLDVLRHILSADERARAERFSLAEPAARFVCGRAALRGILATYVDCPAGEIRFAYGPHGKPALEPCAGGRLAFNATGSADLALCAVTVGRDVGIDVERVDAAKASRAVVERLFAPGEWAAYSRLAPAQQSNAFFRSWTRKEAYLKATGAGLSRPLASFEVTMTPGEPPRLVADAASADPIARWSFVDLDPATDYAGTLVVEGDARLVRWRTWTP